MFSVIITSPTGSNHFYIALGVIVGVFYTLFIVLLLAYFKGRY